MSVNVNKCDFANLKYEQLLSDKYFVETCFSKKFSSYSSKQKLIDMGMKLKDRMSTFVCPPTPIDIFDYTFDQTFN